MDALERAARAHYEGRSPAWDDMPEAWRLRWLEKMAAALRALLVPNEAMLKAMTRSLRSDLLDAFPAQAGKAWTGAIDSILAENAKSPMNANGKPSGRDQPRRGGTMSENRIATGLREAIAYAQHEALRASHERLRKALGAMISSFGFDDPGSERHELMAYQCEALGEARAAIAEASGLTVGDVLETP